MDTIKLRIVRPDRLVWMGEVHHLILTTKTGELGVWPMHAPEICALGDGLMRVYDGERGDQEQRIIISGGYAEIGMHEVIILANHARISYDVKRDSVDRTVARANRMLEALGPNDHNRAYWQEKIAWCNLLYQYGEFND